MKSKGHILMAISVVAVVLAAVATIFKVNVFNIAGTQWILIGIILAVWGGHVESCGCCDSKKDEIK